MGISIDTVLEIVGLIAFGVWVVASVRNSTNLLSEQISQLAQAVAKLNHTVEHLDERTDDHEVRISILEQNRRPTPTI